MYGTVARMRIKPGALEAITSWAGEDGQRPDGFIGNYVYQMDADPSEVYVAVLFRDKESYHANADSPGQDDRYREFRALLAEDPEWHDGEIVYSAS